MLIASPWTFQWSIYIIFKQFSLAQRFDESKNVSWMPGKNVKNKNTIRSERGRVAANTEMHKPRSAVCRKDFRTYQSSRFLVVFINQPSQITFLCVSQHIARFSDAKPQVLIDARTVFDYDIGIVSAFHSPFAVPPPLPTSAVSFQTVSTCVSKRVGQTC